MSDAAEGLQRIKSQMVRRSPTKTDLAKRTPIALTDRDKGILTAIYTHGFLTTELIELAFFPKPPQDSSSPCSRAYERLQQLWRWPFVERVEPPIPRSTGGRRPYLYALDGRGESVVAEQLGQGSAPVQRRRLDRLDSLFVDHDLRIAAFWANLVAMLRPSKARLGHWRAYSFGTFELLEPSRFAERCWVTADSEVTSLLWDGAFLVDTHTCV